MSKKIRCKICHGWGTLKNKSVICRICEGHGKGCKVCKGKGKIKASCHMCEGTGWYKLKEDKAPRQRGRRRRK